MSGIWLFDYSKFAVNWENRNGVTIFWHDVIVSFFDIVLFVLSSLVTDPNFMYIDMYIDITGSGVMTISFCLGLTRNPETRNTPVWVLSNIWRLGRVRNTKFGTNVCTKILLNDAKCQSYSFYYFCVIKEKPTGGDKLLPPLPPTQIRVKYFVGYKDAIKWDLYVYFYQKFVCIQKTLMKLNIFLFW